jgi:hypothetical protein
VVAAQIAASPHIEFHLRWATEILQNHAAWLQAIAGTLSCTSSSDRCKQESSGRQSCVGSLRSVQKSLFDCIGELSRLSDSNMHTLRYLVRVTTVASRLCACIFTQYLQISCGRGSGDVGPTPPAAAGNTDVPSEHVVPAPSKKMRAQQ